MTSVEYKAYETILWKLKWEIELGLGNSWSQTLAHAQDADFSVALLSFDCCLLSSLSLRSASSSSDSTCVNVAETRAECYKLHSRHPESNLPLRLTFKSSGKKTRISRKVRSLCSLITASFSRRKMYLEDRLELESCLVSKHGLRLPIPQQVWSSLP